VRAALAQATADLGGFYERIAVLVGRPVAHQVLLPISVPAFVSLDGNHADEAEVTGVRILVNGVDGTGEEGGVDGAGDAEEPDLVRVITAPHHPHLLWVHEHLQHLSSHAHVITDPAGHVAEQRRLPWWR
jgi:hypothetical protein